MARVIVLVGGGTMGPIVPLLALYKKLSARHPQAKFVWVGTPDGPERQPIEALGVSFVTLPVAKFPRYFSLRLFTWPWDYYRARQVARIFLDKWKPDIVIGAGGYTQVPLMRSASQRGIPCAIHQLDFVPLLSNKLVAKHCALITTSFVYHRRLMTVPSFKYSEKTPIQETPIATPNRFADAGLPERAKAVEYFGLEGNLPIVLFTGGGTGSRNLNAVVEKNLDKWLTKVQIIQTTGHGRDLGTPERPGYVKREFMDADEMLLAYMAADVVVSRAGMGAITDLATLSKASILVPMKNSPQEKNVRHLGLSVIGINESTTLFDDLYQNIIHLINHPEERIRLGSEIHNQVRTDDGSMWADLIDRLLPEDE
ncbi:MAG: UDP-N-acetylglucosamine--N-acetylmuramyl-(pentapeptide) pyrophosphoryl-undecaprenol N-acetylglucosamine transferase [Patescibacteria group bacterium]|jgi:UDP-N-acetylglucosamine--N-acetylmuramyl-(pentapeptide) pyrophosphoryl-undecaprenol N-acetylglucosamine transferase